MRTGECARILEGHSGELSCSQFDFTGEYCVTGSIDRTSILWDVGTGKAIEIFRGHNDEVLDVAFNSTGNKLATASADGFSRVYNVFTGACTAILLGTLVLIVYIMYIVYGLYTFIHLGHEGEISKVSFNPQGSKIITASSDQTCRVWQVDTGTMLQVLEGIMYIYIYILFK